MKLFSVLTVLIFSILNIYAQCTPDKSTTYIHPNATSLMGAFAKFYLKISGSKRKLITEVQFPWHDQSPARIRKKYVKEFTIDTSLVNGCPVYIFSVKTNQRGKYILYLHGGAYYSSMASQHWDFIAELIRKTGATVVVPLYPLLPHYSAKDAHEMVKEVYKIMLRKASADSVILMGDSAGGGLALAFAQQLQKDALPQPAQIIMLSPWLDVTDSNPEIQALRKKDPWIPVELKHYGTLWARKLNTRDPLVSPIYGSFKGLGKISMFIGGHEILLADAKKFKKMLDQQGIAFNYFEYPTMFHDWPLVIRMKEARKAMEQISDLIKS